MESCKHFVDDIECSISAVSGAPISIKGKGRLKCKRLGQDEQNPFIRSLDPPDLTPRDFFLRGYVKDQVHQPTMPQSLRELRQRISRVMASVVKCSCEVHGKKSDITLTSAQ
jgi:hypothetical protein